MLWPVSVVSLLLLGARADVSWHDSSFQPNYVLEAVEGEIPINCEMRHSVTVNGTSPGPTIRLTEGETTWVRVYNRMAEQNLTMVRRFVGPRRYWHDKLTRR